MNNVHLKTYSVEMGLLFGKLDKFSTIENIVAYNNRGCQS